MTITRRATLTALTASPFIIASVATQAAPSGEVLTMLEKTYQEWLSAKLDIDEALDSLPYQLTKFMEKDVLFPLYERAGAYPNHPHACRSHRRNPAGANADPHERNGEPVDHA